MPDNHNQTLAVRCPDGHVSYYDRQELCGKFRVVRRGAAPDAVNVPCKHPGCTHSMVVNVDCEGYR